MKQTHTRAFTLIELLVVVSIIALLSAIATASLNSTRSKARDTKRVADLKQVMNALELYYDKYNYYPNNVNCWDNNASGTITSASGSADTDWSTLNALVTEGFLTTLPQDPKNTGVYRYLYCSDRSSNSQEMVLWTVLENTGSSILVGDYDAAFLTNIGSLDPNCVDPMLCIAKCAVVSPDDGANSQCGTP